ncbi:4'-phosphopantetheinyl transferase [Meredithblackwellia eburnea MCA 4105]
MSDTIIPLVAIQLSKAFPSSELPIHVLDLVDQASRDQIKAFRRPQDAQRCLLGRLLPRYLLSSEFCLRWNSLNFAKSVLGRPYAVHSSLSPFFDYNISHDNDWVFLGWSDSENIKSVGVDVMRIKIPWEGETVDQFVRGLADQLTTSEKAWLRDSGTSQEKLRRAFVIWTLKEAYVKARGEGVKFDFQRLEVFFPNPHKPYLENPAFRVDGKPLEGWVLQLLVHSEEYVVALAVEGGEQSRKPSRLTEVTLDDITQAARA